MKLSTSTLLGTAVASLTLAGCATVRWPTGASDSVIDEAKVAGIDRAAKRLGVTVVWINLPRKTVAVPGS